MSPSRYFWAHLTTLVMWRGIIPKVSQSAVPTCGERSWKDEVKQFGSLKEIAILILVSVSKEFLEVQDPCFDLFTYHGLVMPALIFSNFHNPWQFCSPGAAPVYSITHIYFWTAWVLMDSYLHFTEWQSEIKHVFSSSCDPAGCFRGLWSFSPHKLAMDMGH